MKWQVFRNIYFTKGYNRTLIFDSLKSDVNFIPNDYYDELVQLNFCFEENSLNEELFNFLKENEYIFTTNQHIENLFPPPLKTIPHPFKIGIAVVELSYKMAKNLNKLHDKSVQGFNFGQFNFIFSDFSNTESINLFVDFIINYEVDVIELTLLAEFNLSKKLFDAIKDLNRIFIVNNLSKKNIEDSSSKFKNRMYGNTDIKSLKLSPDMSTYLDSEKYHVYFYNKVFFGRDTEIKNSNGTKEVFGYLNEIPDFDIDSILEIEKFKFYWSVNKRDSLICNQCEFRRICNDNRLPLEIIDSNKWTHEMECYYNPFISKWSDEEGYLNLKNSNVLIENGEVVFDETFLDDKNQKLWGV
jgi:hypothetical protein